MNTTPEAAKEAPVTDDAAKEGPATDGLSDADQKTLAAFADYLQRETYGPSLVAQLASVDQTEEQQPERNP